MDIAERRNPQDGRFVVKINARRIDLRVSTLPTQYGEKVVLRLLETSAPSQDLKALGIPAEIDNSAPRTASPAARHVVGHRADGFRKSTTLYAALQLIRQPSINIVTVEDPIEYTLSGLNQVQVNVKAGLTFASTLRSVLRQDPDVVMIGEIRDQETAEIAIKAAKQAIWFFPPCTPTTASPRLRGCSTSASPVFKSERPLPPSLRSGCSAACASATIPRLPVRST